MRAAHALTFSPLARASDPRPPGALGRVLARIGASRLDRQLAAGTAPWRSRLHAARALQLTRGRARVRLARSLELLAEHAQLSRSDYAGSAVIAPCREQVSDALPGILGIASRLRSGDPVDARGLARLRLLLSDGCGPCYVPIHRSALSVALDDVARWLDTAA